MSETIDVPNLSSGGEIGGVPAGTTEDVEAAVAALSATWGRAEMTAEERSLALLRSTDPLTDPLTNS